MGTAITRRNYLQGTICGGSDRSWRHRATQMPKPVVLHPDMNFQAPALEFTFEATITLSQIYEIGETAYGKRRIFPITGGTFQGPAIKGIILPGGADYQLIRKDGVAELEAKYALQADDGTFIYIINKGLRHGPEEVMKRLAAGEYINPASYYFRTSPVFEVIPGPHDWLSKSVFIGEGIRRKDTVEVRFWRVV